MNDNQIILLENYLMRLIYDIRMMVSSCGGRQMQGSLKHDSRGILKKQKLLRDDVTVRIAFLVITRSVTEIGRIRQMHSGNLIVITATNRRTLFIHMTK
jgi:hypothetical protein